MATKAGITGVEQQEGIDALFIYQDESGKLLDRESSGWKEYLKR